MSYHKQGYNNKSSGSGRSLENLWEKWKNANSLPQRHIEINPVKKKVNNKNSSKRSDLSNTHSTSSPNLFEVISPRDEKWIIVQEALTNSLFGKTITNITEVLGSVRFLAEQSITNVMVDFYETQILRNTLHKMQNRLKSLEDIEKCWIQFYRKSLPNVTLIFSSLKTQQELIENISLFEFKRRVAKVEDLKGMILIKKEEKTFVLKNIINMLLILLPVRRKDKQFTDIDATFEEVVSVLVSPLIGYRGVYVDGELTLEAKGAHIITNILTDSVSKGMMNKSRKSLQGVFSDSKSLLDISGDF